MTITLANEEQTVTKLQMVLHSSSSTSSLYSQSVSQSRSCSSDLWVPTGVACHLS